MTDNQKKAQEFAQDRGHDSQSITEAFVAALDMAEWKDEQLNKAFDKALEHHCEFLKKGKITQYGMDNVFAFVQNVRTLLNSEL